MEKKVDFTSKDISSRMVTRITEYLTILYEVSKYEKKINSLDLAIKMDSTAAQVRKDLSTFGEFGVRGKGYDIEKLIEILEHILGIDKKNKLILVGYGKMGSMLVSNSVVLGKGFEIVEVFDKDKEKIGQKTEGLDIIVKGSDEMDEYIKKYNINQAILAVNKEEAQAVAKQLVKSGIKGILNLTAFKIELPREIAVISVDISAKLQELNFWRRHIDINKKGE
ncbi:redox-sensing transcriptional repressor Rex [Sneathia sp. DSM 16630]|uniref:redox-sensing transcriptional repressor Rex n=1 Tax=uncultured Sneathia sp. TaxID=278067 RepID=UPI0025974061|nr:redox-sensing transcriptional repressor Rex [uncultured Sneathia sp.]MBE2989186.1 redox-sensing transcriptional repressor Rex [Sneathia sp. DSM 16630]